MNEGGGKSQHRGAARTDSRMYGRGLSHLLTVQIEEDYNAVTIMSAGRMVPEPSPSPLGARIPSPTKREI